MNITNNNKNILRLLANGPVIPAPRSIDDFKHALQHHPSPTVILLFGDIKLSNTTNAFWCILIF